MIGSAVAGGAGFVALLVLDRVLGLIGFPAPAPRQISHPPGMTETRQSLEFTYEFTTNRQGLRYREIPLEKPDGTTRIFVVGDSFTEGEGVAADSTFPAIIERAYRTSGTPVDFINGGLLGSGPLDYVRVFDGVGLNYNVDGLLISVFENDVSNMPEVLSDDAFALNEPRPFGSMAKTVSYALFPRLYTQVKMMRDRKREQRENEISPAGFIADVSALARELGIAEERIAEWAGNLPPDLVTAVEEGRFNGGLLSFGLTQHFFHTDALDIDTPRAERKWQSMVTALNHMADTASHHGIAVAMVFIPSRLQYEPAAYEPDKPWIISGIGVRDEWLTQTTEVQQRLAQWTTNREIPFLDLTEAFRSAQAEHDGGLVFTLDGHWTELGHRVAGHAVYQWLTDSNVFGLTR